MGVKRTGNREDKGEDGEEYDVGLNIIILLLIWEWTLGQRLGDPEVLRLKAENPMDRRSFSHYEGHWSVTRSPPMGRSEGEISAGDTYR